MPRRSLLYRQGTRVAQTTTSKQDFSTRLSAETLSRLDSLLRAGRYKTRTAAIEDAVRRLSEAQEIDWARRRLAFEQSCGALKIGVTRESYREAELDRLEFEADRAMGRLPRD